MQKNWIAIILALVLIGFLGWIVASQIKEQHLKDDPMLEHLRQILDPVHPTVKNLKLYKAEKSYTINKDKIFLKVKDENGDYYPLNMQIYVLLHELSHYLNKKDVGHTEEFHRIFDELLIKATDLGVFNPSIPIIDNYTD